MVLNGTKRGRRRPGRSSPRNGGGKKVRPVGMALSGRSISEGYSPRAAGPSEENFPEDGPTGGGPGASQERFPLMGYPRVRVLSDGEYILL